MDDWLRAHLVCPRDRMELAEDGDGVRCANGHRYPVADGTPVMLVDDVPETMQVIKKSIARAAAPKADGDEFFLDTLGISEDEKRGIVELAAKKTSHVDPAVSYLIAATNGIAYIPLIGKLNEYPIPDIRLPAVPGGSDKALLDIGCSWGRWSIAAARKGYRVVGIDPSLGAVMAARRVAKELGAKAEFIVGDARFLPLKDGSLNTVFSYSVIQHFSRADASQTISEVGRVLQAGGYCLIQMPTKFGIRCLQHQARRRFREAAGFEVRYWSLPALRRLFTRCVGKTSFSVDCYFGIGLQATDRHMMSPVAKTAINLSEILRAMSTYLPPMRWVADSVYVSAWKPGTP